MGNTRLGTIPKSKKWTAVVEAVGGGDGATERPGTLDAGNMAAIAQQTLDAAGAALERAKDDVGLRFTFYLLTQVALAARETDWRVRLASVGVHLPEDASLFDLTVELQAAIDDHVASRSAVTDVSEMAQRAAGEILTELAAPRTNTLFGSTGAAVQQAVRPLSTKNGFAGLGQAFFGRFLTRFLNFYLSRITAAQTGGDRLRQAADLAQFNEALGTHCHQSAFIVRDFCGEWYSKTEYQQGISPSNTSGLVAVALEKLKAELAQQGRAG